jgi:hypothetical protein
MQTSYSTGPAANYSGIKDGIAPAKVVTAQATGAIAMGRGVFQMYGYQEQGRLPVENQCVILDDAGTFTAGDIVTTVNGTAITTTFGTDKDTTMTAHAAAILAGVTGVSACAYSAGSHTITIQTRDISLTVETDVSGLTGTMTITSYTTTSLDAATNFLGVTVHDHAREQAADGTVAYASGDAMSVLTDGQIYVDVEETVTANDDVYVRTMADGVKLAGMFGTTSVAGKTVALTNCRFVRGGTTTTPALLSIVKP